MHISAYGCIHLYTYIYIHIYIYIYIYFTWKHSHTWATRVTRSMNSSTIARRAENIKSTIYTQLNSSTNADRAENSITIFLTYEYIAHHGARDKLKPPTRLDKHHRELTCTQTHAPHTHDEGMPKVKFPSSQTSTMTTTGQKITNATTRLNKAS